MPITPFRSYFAAATTVAIALLSPLPLSAGTFAPWEVANVPWGDVLNVRKYPSSKSQIQSAYPNGTVLQMTGTCTGGVDLHEIAGASGDWQAAKVRYRWCQVWHDPAQKGDFVPGWVYGRYIYPN